MQSDSAAEAAGEGADRVLEAAERYVGVGLAVQWLCGPECQSHGRQGHPPDMGGKIPVRGGWSRLGYRGWAEVRSQYQEGYNLSILCGLQPGALLSVAVVDLDSAEALLWAQSHLPKPAWRVKTRRGEHWYYRAAAHVRPENLRHAAVPMPMEVLGNGRQTVAPPSRHAAGHVYESMPGVGEPWTIQAAMTAPAYDPEWFEPLLQRREATATDPAKRRGLFGAPGKWPGPRTFSAEDLERARERALAYLGRCPASRAGAGGDETLHDTAIKLLRGFPIASLPRIAAVRAAGPLPLDPHDAMIEAVAMLDAVWNPRCVDTDGETPYPWDEGRLAYKVGEASRADRLPGPDYWIFDTPSDRERASEARGAAAAWARADVAPEGPGSPQDAPWAAGGASAHAAPADAPERAADAAGGIPAGEPSAPALPAASIDGGLFGGPLVSLASLVVEASREALAPAASAAPGAVASAGAAAAGPRVAQGAVAAAIERARAAAAPGGAAAEAPRDEEPPPPPAGAFGALPDAEPEIVDHVDEVRIKIDHDTERMVRESMRALARMESIYVRQHCLVDVVQARGVDRHGLPRRPWVRKTGKAYLKSRLNSEVYWYMGVDDDGEPRRCRADQEAVAAILAAGDWPGVPSLEGMVYAPIVRGDGSILQIAGYDSATRLIYHPEVDHGAIRENPLRSHVDRARDALLDVICDFPFERQGVCRAVWLAAVLTRFCRFSYSGIAPMFAVSAQEIASGKSLLVDAAAIISDGRPADTMPFVPDESEAKREILALLARDDTHHVSLDNIARGTPLSSSAYEAMLTGQATVGREVGTSEVKRIVMSDAVWWATGNHLEIGADMARRALKIDILDRSGTPTRRRVKHGDLRAYCRDNRARLVRAALTILAGFAAAGGPQASEDCDGVPVGSFASFDAWGRVVRQAVIWAGLPDPCRAITTADEQAAPEAQRSAHLTQHWFTAFGPSPIQVSEAARRLVKETSKYKDLVNWLADHGLVSITPVGLGRFLKSNARGVALCGDGVRRIMTRHEDAGGVKWSIREA